MRRGRLRLSLLPGRTVWSPEVVLGSRWRVEEPPPPDLTVPGQVQNALFPIHSEGTLIFDLATVGPPDQHIVPQGPRGGDGLCPNVEARMWRKALALRCPRAGRLPWVGAGGRAEGSAFGIVFVPSWSNERHEDTPTLICAEDPCLASLTDHVPISLIRVCAHKVQESPRDGSTWEEMPRESCEGPGGGSGYGSL